MRVNQIRLTNFRNYAAAGIELNPGKNIFIGENAQGKTNFLEAIEVAATGQSRRATKDNELIRWGQDNFRIYVGYQRAGDQQSVALALNAVATSTGNSRLEKQVRINGVTHNSYRSLAGKIVAVSFNSQDLNLLRGGPKYRRQWLDDVILGIKPLYQGMLSSYAKVVAQRNRFLKELAEKGRVTVPDQDALSAWDKQLVRFGVPIIKQRLKLINVLTPLAQTYLSQISGQSDVLDAQYVLNISEPRGFDHEEQEMNEDSSGLPPPDVSVDLKELSEEELSTAMLNLLKQRRNSDMIRRHSLIGPHRDDISFSVNKSSATIFASQGQQRSLVLALKLAQLDHITESLREPPLLLLDDVLAELDLARQGALMSSLPSSMQTIITTTHLAGFDPRWLKGASIYNVQQGVITVEQPEIVKI